MSDGADQALNFIYLMGVLVLVGSALVTRHVPIGQTLKMALGWVLIFGAVFLVVTLKDNFIALGRHVFDQAGGDGQIVERGADIRIRKSQDGHFWVAGKINGEEVEFLVDSGATVTSISADAARRAGIEPVDGFPTFVNTVNGRIAVRRGRADRLEVGSIERRNMAVHMAEAFGDTNVLGMNFLSSLSAWGVEG